MIEYSGSIKKSAGRQYYGKGKQRDYNEAHSKISLMWNGDVTAIEIGGGYGEA